MSEPPIVVLGEHMLRSYPHAISFLAQLILSMALASKLYKVLFSKRTEG